MSRGNVENLIPQSERTKDEQREIARQGGIASGEARRKKKSRQEWARIIGSLPIKTVAPDGTALEDADLDAAVVMNMYRTAATDSSRDGVAAAKLVFELNGDLEQSIRLTAPIVAKDADDAAQIQALLDSVAARKNGGK